MSEHADVVESTSSSIGSIALKTAAGGSSLGAVSVVSPMDVPILFGLSFGNICQILGTAYIVGLVIVAIVKKYKAYKKLNEDLYKSSLMGGSGGNGP
jgi:hypothetical protein